LYAQVFSFITPGYDAAIIIAKHYYRLPDEVGPEEPFAGTIKAVTVNDCFHAIFCLYEKMGRSGIRINSFLPPGN
jgi:hypothetical protein